MTGARVAAVETARSGTIAGGVVVDAAGPHAAPVARWAGFHLPVAPQKRTVFAFRCAEPPIDLPLVVDASGFYVRPEGDGYIAGGPAWLPDADPDDLDADYAQFDEAMWPALAHRIPAFERIRMSRAWAALRDEHLRPQRPDRLDARGGQPDDRRGLQRPRHAARPRHRPRRSRADHQGTLRDPRPVTAVGGSRRQGERIEELNVI